MMMAGHVPVGEAGRGGALLVIYHRQQEKASGTRHSIAMTNVTVAGKGGVRNVNVFRQIGVAWIYDADVVTVANGKVTRNVWMISEASLQMP